MVRASRLPAPEYIDEERENPASMPGDIARPVSSISGKRINATPKIRRAFGEHCSAWPPRLSEISAAHAPRWRRRGRSVALAARRQIAPQMPASKAPEEISEPIEEEQPGEEEMPAPAHG